MLFLIGFMLHNAMFAQSIAQNWTVKNESSKVFIENKGQFPLQNKASIHAEDVLFAFDNGQTIMYFKPSGIVYAFNKKNPKKNNDELEEHARDYKSHAEEEREEHAVATTTDLVSMNWENANPDVKLITEEPTTDYFSYSFYDEAGKVKNINHIKGFKKIIYKELYPGIDVEYIFHPLDGVEYSLILHPGADVSNIKMHYSHETTIEPNGDLHITTLFGDIVEHAPKTFYAESKSSEVPTGFLKTNNTITFNLANYDNTKALIIDPWVQTPSLPNSNGVWECEHDTLGNVYIIGGDFPMKLQKYNSAGTLQWTYITPWDTANNWLGTFATDQLGNNYITSGSIASLQKVDNTGSLLWTANSGLFSTNEYWDIAFNCDYTKLMIGGTTGSMSNLMGAIFEINMNNGSIINSIVTTGGNMFGTPPSIQEVRSMVPSSFGNYYFLTLDTIGFINQNFSINPSLYRINSGYSLAYKCENFRPNNGNSGIKALKASPNFLYSLNGTSIQKRSLLDLSVITSVPIPGGISIVDTFGRHHLGNCGIDIDDCGNVYVGSCNEVIKFDANLNIQSALLLSFNVYDISVSNNGEVIVCGATGDNTSLVRTGYVQSINFPACNPMTPYCCDLSIVPVDTVCSNSPITLQAFTTGGVWSGTGITNSSLGIFDPTVAGLGTHTITYTLSCGSYSFPITVSTLAAITICPDQNSCLGTGVQLNVTGGNTYLWSPALGLSSTTISNPFANPTHTTTYTIIVNQNSCPVTGTVTVNVQSVYQNQQICLVTIDPATEKNKIMWDNNPGVGTGSYNIYKEVALNTYDLIGNAPYSTPGFYIDMTSVPLIHADKYKISSVDTCNNASSMSPYHKTINLVVSVFGTTMGLSWSAYVDESGSFVPLKYYIFRGTTAGNITLYDSISSSFTTYNDNNVTSLYYYRIGVKRTPACIGSKGIDDYAFSNVRDNGLSGISEKDNNLLLHIFPNPFNKTTTIEFPNPTNSIFIITITDISGKIVKKEIVSSGKTLLDCSTLESGMYFIELRGEKDFRGKLLIE